MENLGRVLAEWSNDASTHTAVPPSPAQVVKEQQSLKLQIRYASYIHGWEPLELVNKSIS